MSRHSFFQAWMMLPVLCGMAAQSASWSGPSRQIQVGQVQRAQTPDAARRPATQAAPTPEQRGDRAWQANCSRCHNAPDHLSPRITGTVLRHMRVRANMSAADERDILRFLNP